jgi:hypothetical protein
MCLQSGAIFGPCETGDSRSLGCCYSITPRLALKRSPVLIVVRKHSPPRVALDLPGLLGMVDIFRVSGAVGREPAVDLWFRDGLEELKSLAQEWFVRMRRCGDDVREVMNDGCPVACVADAPFGYVNSFNSHVNVGFFYGALLEDPAGLLEGSGKRMRHVKLKPGRSVNGAALGALVDAAYLDIKARLGADRSSRER